MYKEFYRARYYDPSEGRFLSEDPVGYDAGDMNLYRYVFNSSINESDPMGLQAVGAIGGIIRTITIGGPLIICPANELTSEKLKEKLVQGCNDMLRNDYSKCSKLPASSDERNNCFKRAWDKYGRCMDLAKGM